MMGKSSSSCWRKTKAREARQKNCTTCKGSSDHLSKVHCEYIVKMLLHVYASFIQALFKDTNLVNNKKKKNILIKKRKISFLEK